MTTPHKKSDTKNIVAALIFAALTVFLFDYFFPSEPFIKEKPADESAVEAILTAEQKDALQKKMVDEEKSATRIPIETETLKGSIRLTGARFDDLSLVQYHEAQNDKNSPNISLLTPLGTEHATFAEFQFSGLTNGSTPWKANQQKLTANTPLILTYDAGDLLFTRTISVDENYLITVSDTVLNKGAAPVSLIPDGRLVRANPNPTPGGISHEGFFGYLKDKREEITWKEMSKEGPSRFSTSRGWFGLTDKYWFTAFIADDASVLTSYTDKLYQVTYTKTPLTVAPSQSVTTSAQFFAGPKKVNLMDHYRSEKNIPRFDLAIDFGWYYFLTKPFIHVLEAFYHFLGNMGLAILLFAFLVKLFLFPISYKSSKSMANMKKLQPKIKELQHLYKDDKQRLSLETMKLYKENGVNPFGGCLPMIIQIPIFFSLYKVLAISIEMRGAPFYGWIQDLSLPDPSSVFTLFGLIPWTVPSFLDIGILPLVMGVTMFLQQKMTPQPPQASGNKNEPNPMAVMKWMPLIFTFLLGRMAAGLVLYWTWSNLLGIAQQAYINHKVRK